MVYTEMLRKGAIALSAASLALTLCACTATQDASPAAPAPQDSSISTGEPSTDPPPSDGSDSASSQESFPETADSASASSASAGSSVSSKASGSSEGAAFRLLPSPELLTKSRSASSDESADGDSDSGSYSYEGPFEAVLEADGQLAESYDEVIESSAAGSTVALARNGGTLVLANGKLVKIGEDTSLDEALAYGTEALALAVNADSNMLLSSVIAESACPGSAAVFSCDGGSSYGNDVTIVTSGDDSAAVRATYGGLAVLNGLQAQTEGARSPGIACAGSHGAVSVANSAFETAGSLSPVLECRGRVEADGITGATGASPLAILENQGTVLISGSRLTSTSINGSANGGIPCAVMLYRADTDAPAGEEGPALFQAADSLLGSTIQAGAFFYLTNTEARVLLSDTRLEFDEDHAALLKAEGNNGYGWGTSGKNGAFCDFTARNQKLKGTVEVDSLSSVDLYLLDDSQWTGSSSIRSNASGSAVSENLNVNIDGTSAWTVTGNSTVTNINLADGGKLVDTRGRSVKLVDQNGFTLVDGASNVTVTVNGSFSTTVKTGATSQQEEPSIDRAAFDGTFGTETAFGTNESRAYTAEEQRVAELREAVKAWFARL